MNTDATLYDTVTNHYLYRLLQIANEPYEIVTLSSGKKLNYEKFATKVSVGRKAELDRVKWSAEKNSNNEIYPRHAEVVDGATVTTLMSRYILASVLNRKIATGMVADHFNGDPLDNRDPNLTEITQPNNLAKAGFPLGPSGHVGVRPYVTKKHGDKFMVTLSAKRDGRVQVIESAICENVFEGAMLRDSWVWNNFGYMARYNYPWIYDTDKLPHRDVLIAELKKIHSN